MGSAQLDLHSDDELTQSCERPLPPFELTEPDRGRPALKQEVAQRLAAHRARRGAPPASAADPAPQPGAAPTSRPSRPSRVRSAHIAAAVAERYAHSQSYRAFLAAEAERAVHQAEAEAEVATINAQAIAEAQQRLLADLEHWNVPLAATHAASSTASSIPLSPLDYAAVFDREFTGSSRMFPDPATIPEPRIPRPSHFTVRPFADSGYSVTAPHPRDLHPSISDTGRELDEDERLALDEEIAFRHNPVFDEALHQEPIPANLIEFPRQLVAPRKARPRIAEGPLREDGASTALSQMRIFEVEPDHLSSTPANDSAGPEWTSILLSALPVSEFAHDAETDYLSTLVPQAAPISRRLLSAAVDGFLILSAEAAFTGAFVFALKQLPGQHAALEIPRLLAVAGALATLAVFTVVYQLLFFTFTDSTPGMRYARIGLCTFSDENPTRSAMRRRLLATLLAALPLGLGLLWAFLDEDSLGWHDRIARMYQRSY